MKGSDLIAQAHRLARATKQRPRQVDLKRAVSDAYYAMFHELAKECADTVAGSVATSRPKAWQQVYRSLEHGGAKSASEQAKNKNFPLEIIIFAETFVEMQNARHNADYNPAAVYVRAKVTTMITEAQVAIVSLRTAARPDRRAFVALVLFPSKRRR